MKKLFMLIMVSMIIITGCGINNTIQVVNEKAETVHLGSKEKELQQDISGIPAKVVNVVDGDTIDVIMNGKKERVRFILVDTPETKHPQMGVQPFGEEASNFTKEQLLDQDIILELDVAERDRYGRLLAYIWLNGKNFNEILIERGLARVAVFPPNTKYVDRFREIQQTAQEQAIGIWSIENYVEEKGFNKEKVKKNQSLKEAKSGCKIKGNISSSGEMIYHMPGGVYYDRTNPEEWFCSKEEAEKAGYRASKR